MMQVVIKNVAVLAALLFVGTHARGDIPCPNCDFLLSVTSGVLELGGGLGPLNTDRGWVCKSCFESGPDDNEEEAYFFSENTYGRNTRSFARAINIKNEKDAQVEANRTRKNVEYTAYRVTVWPSCDVVKMRIPKLTKPIR
jgi:hypothetical protein